MRRFLAPMTGPSAVHPRPALGAFVLSNSYALAMFSRTAGSVLVLALATSFHVGIAEASLIATVFFWVYALLQLPAGILADLLGPRRLAVLGALVTGIGSLAFAAATSLDMAVFARALVAAGCAVVFVSMMRHIRTHWTERRMATVSGRCILVGNLGAIASAGPLSLLLATVDWRTVCAGIGLLSFVIAAVLWRVMDDALASRRCHTVAAIATELRAVVRNPYCQIGLLLMAGLAGSYYGLASLWILPLLMAQGIGNSTAALHASLLIAGFALGACLLGWLGDRSGRRWTLTTACIGAFLCWSVLATTPRLGSFGVGLLLFALGFCSGSFNLVYALVIERNPLAHAGTATAFVNIGIFLGAGTVQALSTRLYVGSRGDFGMTLQPMLAGSLLAALLSLSLFYRVRTPVAPSANLP
jgi:MFS family permease